MMDEKKALKETTDIELEHKLERWWKSPGTGVPNAEALVITSEMFRRIAVKQEEANRLQRVLNIIFGITGIGSLLMAILQYCKH
jgi:hypothetical protein